MKLKQVTVSRVLPSYLTGNDAFSQTLFAHNLDVLDIYEVHWIRATKDGRTHLFHVSTTVDVQAVQEESTAPLSKPKRGRPPGSKNKRTNVDDQREGAATGASLPSD